jgi:hypothetical protein
MSLYATTPHPNPENTRQRSKKSCSQSDASRQPYAPAAAPVLIGAKYARPFSQALRGLGCLGIPASSVLPPLQ